MGEIDGVRYAIGQHRTFMAICQDLDLRHFPTDCQDLNLTIESLLPTEKIMWKPMVKHNSNGRQETYPFACIIKDRCELSDFELVKECPMTQEIFLVEIDENRQICRLSLTVKLVRKSTYYITNVGWIMFVLVSLDFVAWGLHPGDLPDRLGLDFDLILIVMAYKLVFATMLPAVAYLTRLDLYVIFGFGMLLIMTVVHALFPYEHYRKIVLPAITWPKISVPHEETLINEDTFALYIFAFVWVLWNLLYGLYCFLLARREYTRFWTASLATQAKSDLALADPATVEVKYSARMLPGSEKIVQM